MTSSGSHRYDESDFEPGYPLWYGPEASPRASSISILPKALHLVAAGWVLSVAYLWLAMRHTAGWSAMDPRTLVFAAVPLVFIEALAWSAAAWTPPLRRRLDGEWWRAIGWSLVPNLLLLAAVAAIS